MLTVTQIDYIKHLRENEGASISEIASRLKCSWKTAKKYADGEVDLQKRHRRARKKTVMEGYEEFIEAMLEENQLIPRKQRKTAKAIFDELQKIGYQGSERTVRDYVCKIKQQMRIMSQTQAVRLEHFPGEAQVDFTEFQAICSKKLKTFHLLVMSFPYSNARVGMVLPSENMVCFPHGLQVLFHLIGGVPRVIRFDNLSAAVTKILSGTDRALTEMFKQFQWHYRFKTEFCNPGKGQEKGHVEVAVGYSLSNNLNSLPTIDDLNTFNQNLHEEMLADRNRIHYEKRVLISELWKDDEKHLLQLPSRPLEIVQMHAFTVNKYGEIKVDGQIYRIPNAVPQSRVMVKAFWDHLEIMDRYGEVVLHTTPRIYFQKAENIDWAARLEIFITKPRAAERAVCLKALPDVIEEYILTAADLKERRQRIIAMVEILRQYPLDVAVKTARTALEYGKTDISSLKIFAAHQAGELIRVSEPIEEPWTPSEVAQWQPDLSIYDRLGVIGHGK